MSYATRLNAEINALLDDLAREGKDWRATWVAHEICTRHSAGLTGADDADFWRHTGYSDCRREVRRCINRRAGDRPEHDHAQTDLLPGYKHLQAYYVVEREEEAVGLPIQRLSREEIMAKASAYRRMGEACFAHADELDRYLRLRA